MNDTHCGKMSEAELSKKLGQYQKQALSKNGKQVLLIFEYIPHLRFFPKMG